MSSIISSFNDFELDDLDGDADDYLIAFQIQMQIDNQFSNKESEEKSKPEKNQIKNEEEYSKIYKPNIHVDNALIDPTWDLIDPCPDIRAMFQEFDKLYFWNRLGSCIVEWSKRMTICAGIFYLRGGGIIRLSEPLLKFRPRKDLVETLLHEMIHAYLYLTRNFKDRGDHGDEFKGHMNRINKSASTNISVYHSFHDEVNHQRQHVWRCTGTCRELPPFHGFVKRSMNRAPGKNDTWWAQHQSKCKGTFEKISEPESYKKKSTEKQTKENVILVKKKETTTSNSSSNSKTLETFFSRNPKLEKSSLNDSSFVNSQPISSSIKSEIGNPKKRKLDEPKTDSLNKLDFYLISNNQTVKKEIQELPRKKLVNNEDIIVLDDDTDSKSIKKLGFKTESSHQIEDLIECPMCFKRISSSLINSHVNNHF